MAHFTRSHNFTHYNRPFFLFVCFLQIIYFTHEKKILFKPDSSLNKNLELSNKKQFHLWRTGFGDVLCKHVNLSAWVDKELWQTQTSWSQPVKSMSNIQDVTQFKMPRCAGTFLTFIFTFTDQRLGRRSGNEASYYQSVVDA